MHVKKLFLGADYHVNDGIKGVLVLNLAIEMATVTAVKESTYALGLYATFAWLSNEAELVVMLSAGLIGFLCSENKIKCFVSCPSPKW